MVEHAVEGGSAQVHQGVVGRLLLLAAGVTVEEVVDLISYFWKCRHGHPSVTPGDKTQLLFKRVAFKNDQSETFKTIVNENRLRHDAYLPFLR